jgi:chlorobactene glucosyltransferase
VLIPARDEAEQIGAALQCLLTQDYPAFEVLVLDDQSSDGTGEAARRAGEHVSAGRLRVLAGAPLPPGWLGKNWACHQLAQAAHGEVLVFSDADVRFAPGALAALAQEFRRSRAHLLTVWPTQITHTWAERLTVPLMALVVIGYLPLLAVHYLPWKVFAAAMGQCLAFEREAYVRIGGHAALRRRVLDDMAFAYAIKGAGLRLRMADGAGLIACRMYRGWQAARDGYAKNILAGHGGRISLLALSAVFHWAVFVGPWAWLALGAANPALLPGVGGWGLAALGALGIGARLLSAVFTRQRPADALLLPVSVALMTVIAARSAAWRLGWGRPQWKGRSLGDGGSSGSPAGSLR